MTGAHEPSPEFRTFLESEIVRTLRRETRLGSPVRTVRRGRLRTAAIVLVALSLGAAAGAAPARVQDARQRDELLEAVRAEAQLAAMRLDLARAAFDDARRKFEAGAIGRESLASAEVDLRTMETYLARIRLNQEEIRATAGPPRDEMTAPAVGERDFVSERLRLELASAQQRLSAAERIAAELERRHRLGAVPRVALLDAQIELERAKGELGMLAVRLSVRQDFLARHLEVADVERRLQREQLLHEAALAQHLHALAQERLENLRELNEAGIVETLEVKRAEVDALERAMEVERIRRQLQLLEAAGRGGRAPAGG
jgi:hypothetical protein